MPVAAARKITFSPEEYFDWEERQDERFEYANGEVFPMPGGTYEHFLIIANWVRHLGESLAGRAAVLGDGMRLQIRDRRFVYPDVTVVVGDPAFREGSGRRALLNPQVVVEVLSETTRDYDRGEKYALYREVPSLREIVWIDSERRWAEVGVKADGAWTVREPITDGAVEIPSLALAVPLDDLYRGVSMGEGTGLA